MLEAYLGDIFHLTPWLLKAGRHLLVPVLVSETLPQPVTFVQPHLGKRVLAFLYFLGQA